MEDKQKHEKHEKHEIQDYVLTTFIFTMIFTAIICFGFFATVIQPNQLENISHDCSKF